LKRLPAFHEVLPVFAVLSTLFYGWTSVVFLWKLPSWLFFLTAGEIMGIFAYQMVTNFIESLAFLILLLTATAILPPKALKNEFVVRGSMISFLVIGSMMLFLHRYASVGPEFGHYLYWWMIVTLFLSILLARLSTDIKVLRVSLSWFSDQLIIFLFVLIPLSALSFIYVLVSKLS